MTKIEITTKIRENMNTVINTLHLICDEGGLFNFDDLRATGLKRLDVVQTISFMKRDGYSIFRQRGETLSGCDIDQWVWNDVYWARAYAEKEVREQEERESLASEQAAAVAEVEQIIQG